MIYSKKCKYCGSDFETNTNKKVFCSKSCTQEYFVRKTLLDNSEYLKANCIEGTDYVIDLWNGLAVKRLYGAYFRKLHPGKTIKEYLSEFPNAKISSDKDRKNTSINSGKFMKEEKYKKMYSERMSGDKNPMSKSNTTSEFRKSCSPFSSLFYEKRGMDESDRQKFISSVVSSKSTDSYTTSKEYYIKRGYTEEDAIRMLSIRQSTKTLESCIRKYGEYGYEIYRIRNAEWSRKMEEMYKKGLYKRSPKNGIGYSNEEKELIQSIIKILGISDSECKYHKNSIADQLVIFNNGTNYYYDFQYRNKIIEYNGTYWHCDPRFYDEGFKINGGTSAKEIWERDLEKTRIALEKGYSILHVWESDYKDDKEKIINECINFLIK